MGRERTGRRIRKESRELDKILKQVVKEKVKESPYVVLKFLCDIKNYSHSDYERFVKWYSDFRKGRNINLGLLVDVLLELGIDPCKVIKEAVKRRNYGNS